MLRIVDGVLIKYLLTVGYLLVIMLSFFTKPEYFARESLFAEVGPLYLLASSGIWAYAFFVIILAVIMAIWIGRLAEKSKKKA